MPPIDPFVAPEGEPLCPVTGDSAGDCDHAELPAVSDAARVIALAIDGEYQCADCLDIGLLLNACWDGAGALRCPQCTGHPRKDFDFDGCAECGPAVTVAVLRKALGFTAECVGCGMPVPALDMLCGPCGTDADRRRAAAHRDCACVREGMSVACGIGAHRQLAAEAHLARRARLRRIARGF